MPFELVYLPCFERWAKRLGARERHVTSLVIRALSEYFTSDLSPTGQPHAVHMDGRSYRLVFKKLQGHIWESYIEGRVRVLTRQDGGCHYLVFAGNHDEVRRFLKEN